jgi:hypothetical protein
MSSSTNNTPYLTMSKRGSWNLKPSMFQTRRVAQLRWICKQTINNNLDYPKHKKEGSIHTWMKEEHYHLPLMSWFMWGKMFMTTHLEWITFPLFSRNDLNSLRTIGSLSWKMMIAPSPHKYCLQSQILHRHNSWPFGSNGGLNMGEQTPGHRKIRWYLHN